ncbi:MAG: hypothetical protein GEV08_18545 [Acidimicrobiia bacterium]|nr:hypothetical protein [Acidimicrobiia bacterium]
MSPASRRRAVTGGLAAAAALVAGVPWISVWGELPDPVATHFALGGDADGHLPRLVAAASTAGLGLVGAVALAVLGARARARPVAGATALVAGLAAVLAVLSGAVALANRGVGSWHDARLAGWVVLLAWAAMAGAAVMALRAMRSDAATEGSTTPPGARPRLKLGEGDRAAWTGTATSRWALPVGAASGALAVLVWFTSAPAWVALTILATGLPCLAFGSLRVTAGVRGVRVAAGPGWPRVSVPLERIAVAEAIDLQPSTWGGGVTAAVERSPAGRRGCCGPGTPCASSSSTAAQNAGLRRTRCPRPGPARPTPRTAQNAPDRASGSQLQAGHRAAGSAPPAGAARSRHIRPRRKLGRVLTFAP